MKKQLIIAVIAILVLAGLGWVWAEKTTPEKKISGLDWRNSAEWLPKTGGATTTGISPTVTKVLPTTDKVAWSEYRNEDVGISISYPVEYIRTPFAIRPGLAGKIFYAVFDFPSGAVLSVTSITKDYDASKDGNWGTGFGYELQKENYFLKLNNLIPVSPKEFWYAKNGEKAIVLYQKDFSKKTQEEFYAPDVLATVNLPKDSFSGLGFELNSSPYPVSQEEINVVKKMVYSLSFIK